jgi:serine protease Do
LIVALGHPWGLNGVTTVGIFTGRDDHQSRNLLAVNLCLRLGNSGGPLFDVEGKLEGTNTMMIGPDTGLAIPVEIARKFLRENRITA